MREAMINEKIGLPMSLHGEVQREAAERKMTTDTFVALAIRNFINQTRTELAPSEAKSVTTDDVERREEGQALALRVHMAPLHSDHANDISAVAYPGE